MAPRRRSAIPPGECPAAASGARLGAVEPQNIERHIGGRPRAPDEVVKLRASCLVGRDHLAVEDGVVDIERRRQLIAERIKAGEPVAVARDEAAVPLLDVAEAPVPVIFEIEEPAGVVERLSSRCW
jgi:hypothetical protein